MQSVYYIDVNVFFMMTVKKHIENQTQIFFYWPVLETLTFDTARSLDLVFRVFDNVTFIIFHSKYVFGIMSIPINETYFYHFARLCGVQLHCSRKGSRSSRELVLTHILKFYVYVPIAFLFHYYYSYIVFLFIVRKPTVFHARPISLGIS